MLYQGVLYKVEMCDTNNQLYGLVDLTKIFADIIERDERDETTTGRIAALTADRRSLFPCDENAIRETWAANRKRFFLEDQLNCDVLSVIESAAFTIAITDDEYGWSEVRVDKVSIRTVQETPDGLSRQLLETLTGNGANRWADKSHNYVVSRNGRSGGTIEHSVGDGFEFDHVAENHYHAERYVLP